MKAQDGNHLGIVSSASRGAQPARGRAHRPVHVGDRSANARLRRAGVRRYGAVTQFTLTGSVTTTTGMIAHYDWD
jgi:hypothetical protein